MSRLATKFIQLKTKIGGNREVDGYENTFGMPREEQAHITAPSRANIRILSELEFALNLSEAKDGRYDEPLFAALDYLLACIEDQGVLSNAACEKAEDILSPLESAAKEYKLILASHAHIDMNWMWSFDETVAVTLATFRSILHIMDQYPDFCFSQSQAAVYKIVEEYDPGLMEEIKKRIEEGRWEVTAAAWVETDKNMPDGESLLRHILYTREYLSKVWGVKNFEIDFSPDTFGHSGNVPEINQFGGVKYYYHCRGNAREDILYLYRSPSGSEVLAYREPNWYNGAITPKIGAGIIKISKQSCGLKTGLVIYGVGDHGGGPTRRDVERALEMMEWRIYPEIKFGTVREYFMEAEALRHKLPVVKEELNYFAPGCYTTQSRIKRGNKRLESTLLDAESMAALAGKATGFRFERSRFEKAWQDVLFTHFHDILTGSCVQDSREHAMGLYQTSMACAGTQLQNAMRVISEQIDTSLIPVDIDAYNSQSEGGGAGYGVENFKGVPSTERGSGRTRIFHIFNTQTRRRSEVVELTVWDWTGDLRRMQVKDYAGEGLVSQLLDKRLQTYWDHKYIRILVDVTVPALGYTTVVLSEKEAESYPVYLQESDQASSAFDDYVLANDQITVVIDAESGRIRSLKSNDSKEELVAAGRTAGLNFLETEANTSSAWNIGRWLKEMPVDRCIKMECKAAGPLRNCVKAVYRVEGSTAAVNYILDKHQAAVRMEMEIDWHEIGKETVPVLAYEVPVAYRTSKYRYDIPAGTVLRDERRDDVPALRYGMAVRPSGDCAVLISDSKYGYRGYKSTLALTLLNSSTSPDPYPERGVHKFNLWLGVSSDEPKHAEEMASGFHHKMFYQPSNSHTGTLPMEQGLLESESDSIVISSVMPGADGSLILRGYETAGVKAAATFVLKEKPIKAAMTDLFEHVRKEKPELDGCKVKIHVEPYSIFQLKIWQL